MCRVKSQSRLDSDRNGDRRRQAKTCMTKAEKSAVNKKGGRKRN